MVAVALLVLIDGVLDLLAQGADFHRHFNDGGERLRSDGLADKIEGAQLEGLFRGFHIAVGGHHEHDAVGLGFPQALQDVEPVYIGQSHVQQDQVDVPVPDGFQALLAILRQLDAISFVDQGFLEGLPDQFVVVRDKNGMHQEIPFAEAAGSRTWTLVPLTGPSSMKIAPSWASMIL